jgi:alpha-D-ribose 1-methylphosphonate 5-triphosphate diphosphatase
MDALVDKRLADRERFYAKHRAEITALCQKLGLRVASHDDATVAHVEEAAAAGAVIAEFPTTIEAAQAVHDWGLSVMAGAPNLVCGRSHSGNIAAGDLAARGLLDILSSDYVPASALHAAFLLRDRCGFPLPAALATVTAEPAARVGLDDRGEISPGRRADLLRVGRVGETPVVRAVWRCGQRVA